MATVLTRSLRIVLGGRWHHPLRLMKLADHSNLAEGRCAADDFSDVWAMLCLHGIPLRFRLPMGDSDQAAIVTDLAMQFRPPRARRLLNEPAGAHPGIRIFIGAVAVFDVNFEDEFHLLPLPVTCLLLRPLHNYGLSL